MATGDKNLPVDLVVVEPTKIDGKHIEVGTVLKKVEPDVAFDLAAAGKCRLHTKELESDMKARAKAEAEAAENRKPDNASGSPAQGGVSAKQLADVVQSAIEQGIKAGIALALQAESAPETGSAAS